MSSEAHVSERLGLIRYWYDRAAEQSLHPEPMNGMSVLMFHDAVELFLALTAERLDVSVKDKMAFMKYWPAIDQKLGDKNLSQKAAMDHLNTARVSLKHHGIRPTSKDVERFRVNTADFFEENTPLVFGKSFDSISMVDLVALEKARELLREATELKASDSEMALVNVAEAFARIFADYKDRAMSHGRWDPFSFGGVVESFSTYGMRDSRVAEMNHDIRDIIEEMQTAMRVIALGIDYRRYAKFILLTPETFGALNRGYEFRRTEKSEHPTDAGFRFCFDFVIECAIRLQSFDIDLE